VILLVRPDRFCMVHAALDAAEDRIGRAHALLTGNAKCKA
jgi:hypothetical protein